MYIMYSDVWTNRFRYSIVPVAFGLLHSSVRVFFCVCVCVLLLSSCGVLVVIMTQMVPRWIIVKLILDLDQVHTLKKGLPFVIELASFCV